MRSDETGTGERIIVELSDQATSYAHLDKTKLQQYKIGNNSSFSNQNRERKLIIK